MLISFSVENYKGFKDKIELNFENVHDYKFNNQCIRNGLLNKIVIYGPNASGKSNFGFALFDIVGLLTDKNIHVSQMDELSFINADSTLDVATFKYVFKNNQDKITYLYKKSAPKILVYEELHINDKLIYAYDFHEKKFKEKSMEHIYADSLNFEYFENNFAILRYIANNTNQPDNSIVKFIMNFVSHMLWFRSLQNNVYIGLTTGGDNLSQWIADNNLVKDFQRFIYELAGIDKTLEVIEINQPSYQKILVEKHKNKILPFEQIASSGCHTLELFYYWSKRFNEVSFLFMDEFDAFYHFDLATNVIKYMVGFDNAQVIFTTHNSKLASNDLLRPDCYFNLQNGRLVSFVDSTDRELREGHNLEKMLRNGEFNG